MGEARRRRRAGNKRRLRGRFVLFGVFQKPGDLWLEALVITPWRKAELTEPQWQAVENAVEQLVVAARDYYDEAEDGDAVIRQAWLNVPPRLWKPCLTQDEADQMVTTASQLVLRCAVSTSETGPLVSISRNDLRPTGPVN